MADTKHTIKHRIIHCLNTHDEYLSNNDIAYILDAKRTVVANATIEMLRDKVLKMRTFGTRSYHYKLMNPQKISKRPTMPDPWKSFCFPGLTSNKNAQL